MNLADEILSKKPNKRLPFISELQKRDKIFYDRMRHLAERSIAKDDKIESSSSSEISRILNELST